MMKFFRKYNKALLAVFMVLLMVVFIGGSAMESLLTPNANRLVASSRLGSITSQDQEIASATTGILEGLSFAGIPTNWRRPVPGASEDLEIIDWILLQREAAELKTTTSVESIRAQMADATFIKQFARSRRIKSVHIFDALAQLETVRRVAVVVAQASSPSEAEVRAAAKRVLEKVKINAVVLPAEAFVDSEQTFSEKQIQDQFTTYRERKAEGGIKFGYYMEPAIRVQYIKINRDVIAKTVRVANIERKARAYFDKYRTRNPDFRRPEEELAVEPDSVEGPVAEPKPYLDWEEAKEIAIERVRVQEADAVASRIVDWFVPYVAEPWLSVARDKDSRYKDAPDLVKDPGYYQSVVDKTPASISYPGAISVITTDFFPQADASDVPQIGPALHVTPNSFVPGTLGTLAFRNSLLIPKIPDTKETVVSNYLAAFQTCRYSLRDADGNVFVFRVVESRPGQIPDTVDQVRDKVIADLRLAQAFETVQYRADSLRSCDECNSLQEAFDLDGELVSLHDNLTDSNIGYYELLPFARAGQFDAAKGDKPASRFVGPGVESLPIDAIEKCFALAHADEKITTIELDDRATVVVVEWVETEPAIVDDFEQMRTSFVQQMDRYRSQDVVSKWLNPDNIRARNEFQLVTK